MNSEANQGAQRLKDCSGEVNGLSVKITILKGFIFKLFYLVVDEKRKSKTTHMVLLEIIKEEGL